MTNFSRASARALAVLTVVCVPFLAYQSSDTITASGPHDEPQMAAANPVGAKSWTILPNIKNGRFESTAIQYRDDIYTFNGFGKGIDVESTVEKFDAGTKKWSVIGKTSIAKGNAVTHNGVVVHGNEVWIIGGRVGNHPGAVTNKVWKYNLNTSKWTKGPQLPVPVAAGGAALVDNRIHWFGGLDPKAACDVSNHYVYDLNKPSAGWSDISGLAPMPIPRNHFATVVHKGLIYAIGGQFTHDGCGGGTPDTALSHMFNPKTNTWKQIASLPAVQSHIEPSSFVYKGAIYVVGGATTGNKVYRYDPSKDDWDTVAVLPQPLLAPVARVVDDKLVVSTGGAPAIVPSLATYSTDMAPLLLPGAGNTNNNSDITSDTETTSDPAPEAEPDPIVETAPDPVPETASDSVLETDIATAPDVDNRNIDVQATNNNSSNEIDDENTSAGVVGECLSADSDPDGDGWGWESGASCIVSSQPTIITGNSEPLTLEAEYHDVLTATDSHQWVSVTLTDASNNAAMKTADNNNTLANGSQGSPSMAYFAHFDRPGTWYLWVRGWGDTVNGEGKSDSLHAGLNGKLSTTADNIENFPSDWKWSNSTRDNVRASLDIPTTGIHTVNLWMREDGLTVDKILLTPDPAFVPVGVGLAHDDGTTTTTSQVEPETVDTNNIRANDNQVTAVTTTESESDNTSDSITASIKDTSTDGNKSGGGSQHLIDIFFLLILLAYLPITKTNGKQRRPFRLLSRKDVG